MYHRVTNHSSRPKQYLEHCFDKEVILFTVGIAWTPKKSMTLLANFYGVNYNLKRLIKTNLKIRLAKNKSQHFWWQTYVHLKEKRISFQLYMFQLNDCCEYENK